MMSCDPKVSIKARQSERITDQMTDIFGILYFLYHRKHRHVFCFDCWSVLLL